MAISPLHACRPVLLTAKILLFFNPFAENPLFFVLLTKNVVSLHRINLKDVFVWAISFLYSLNRIILMDNKKNSDLNHYERLSEALALLKKLIAIPSISKEEKEAADLLEQFFEGHNVSWRRIGNNILSMPRNYNKKKPNVLLCAHIDTVRPVNGWQRDPFCPTESDGCIFGLGSNDDGGSLVSLLLTYIAMESTEQSYNLIFLASSEEEISGANGFELVREVLPPIAVAIVGEPTGMQPAIAEKGLMVLDVIEHGTSGHAARNEGVNAIYMALDDIAWLRDYKFERVSPFLGPVKMTVTVINAGTQHNVIPDLCTFLVDVRPNELYGNVEVYDIIASHLRGEVRAHSFRLNSSLIAPTHPLVKQAIGMGLTPFGSPTLSDQALMPFPSLKIGPGQSSRSHTADEYIEIAEIDNALRVYPKLLDRLKL
jgi:acetylornithine deacetylase